MLAVSLALVASFCWGVADFGGGLMSRRIPAVVVLLAQQAFALVVVGLVIVAVAEGPPDERAIWLSIAAGAMGAFALGTFYRALALGTMSIVAPISASGVVVPVIVGIASGDRPTAVQAAGLAVSRGGLVAPPRGGGGTRGGSHRGAVCLRPAGDSRVWGVS